MAVKAIPLSAYKVACSPDYCVRFLYFIVVFRVGSLKQWFDASENYFLGEKTL